MLRRLGALSLAAGVGMFGAGRLISDDYKSGSNFPSRDSFEHAQTAVRNLDALAVSVSS